MNIGETYSAMHSYGDGLTDNCIVEILAVRKAGDKNPPDFKCTGLNKESNWNCVVKIIAVYTHDRLVPFSFWLKDCLDSCQGVRLVNSIDSKFKKRELTMREKREFSVYPLYGI